MSLALVALAAPAAHARLAVSPNWRLDTPPIPGRGEDAVGLAVDPRNPRHIVEINADWEAGQCQHHVSFNGGRTWSGGDFPVPAAWRGQPCNVGPHLAEHIKQSVVWGSRQNVYATFSSPVPNPQGTQAGKTLFVAISHNGGRTWGVAHPVATGGPTATPGPNYTLPTIGVDPARRGGPRHDILYVAADTTSPSHSQPTSPPPGTPSQGSSSVENIAMSVSRDGGRSWGGVFNVNAADTQATEQSDVVVGRKGTVYIAWRELGQGSGDAAANGFIVVAKSSDHGRTWKRTKSTAVMGYIYSGPPGPPFGTPPAVYTASTFPELAIDPRRNYVYLVFGQGPPQVPYVPGHPSRDAHAADHFINPYSAVYFQRSTNGDRTWSDPLRINYGAQLGTNPVQTRHPSVSVNPNGRVNIVWQDRRNWYRGCTNTHVACPESRLGDTYYAFSTNGGRSFSVNYRLSDRSTNNDVGYDYRFGTYWAYGPQSVPLGNAGLLVGWMDSRMGNFQNDTQDIYLTKLTFNARKGVPVVRRRHAGSPESFSVNLSRLAYPGGPEAVLAGTFISRPWTRVVIVNDHDVADTLAGGVLARANIGPVLASPAAGLTPGVKGEVARLQPIGAYVIGNPTQLSPKVEADLAALGVPPSQIVRIAGADTADTARQIAEAADRRTAAQKSAKQPAFDAAIIANPSSPDAVSAAVLAAARRLPILYVGQNTMPPETKLAIQQLNITRTLVIGSPKAVSNAVAGQLPLPERLAGSTPYRTSNVVARASVHWGVPDNIVYTASAGQPVQTALLGAALGRTGALLLLSPNLKAAQRTIASTLYLRRDVNQLIGVQK